MFYSKIDPSTEIVVGKPGCWPWGGSPAATRFAASRRCEANAGAFSCCGGRGGIVAEASSSPEDAASGTGARRAVTEVEAAAMRSGRGGGD
ncbi:uncharacterized protein A4U43_C06F1950 [Asparagus officinalis]|uniref:Uncharacterized protein n=1 Tax=Asparagus officinalis TaxID=4686 RepID=A0A5P1EIX3_ASPOF|nr:uncharacterized protein A4U43_C06F1950 [Asparagus officinalis]